MVKRLGNWEREIKFLPPSNVLKPVDLQEAKIIILGKSIVKNLIYVSSGVGLPEKIWLHYKSIKFPANIFEKNI